MKSFIHDKLVLTDHELEQVLGGAETTSAISDYRKGLLTERDQLIQTRETIENVKMWAPMTNNPIQTFLEHAKAGERLNEIAKELNADAYQRNLEIERRQAQEAEDQELEDAEREAQEKEEEEWLAEADAELAEQDAAPSHQGGGDAGVPVNTEAPNETLPPIPTYLVNPPPSHEPQIILEPIGDADVHW